MTSIAVPAMTKVLTHNEEEQEEEANRLATALDKINDFTQNEITGSHTFRSPARWKSHESTVPFEGRSDPDKG